MLSRPASKVLDLVTVRLQSGSEDAEVLERDVTDRERCAGHGATLLPERVPVTGVEQAGRHRPSSQSGSMMLPSSGSSSVPITHGMATPHSLMIETISSR